MIEADSRPNDKFSKADQRQLLQKFALSTEIVHSQLSRAHVIVISQSQNTFIYVFWSKNHNYIF